MRKILAREKPSKINGLKAPSKTVQHALCIIPQKVPYHRATGRSLDLLAMRTSLSEFMVFVALLVVGCGLITEQSIYEGLRTQQSVKDAGAVTLTEKMGTYDPQEKQRQQAKDPQ